MNEHVSFSELTEHHSSKFHSSHLRGVAWAAQQVWNLQLKHHTKIFTSNHNLQFRRQIFFDISHLQTVITSLESEVTVVALLLDCYWTFMIMQGLHKTTFITAIMHLQADRCAENLPQTGDDSSDFECIRLMITGGFKLWCLCQGSYKLCGVLI